jgi:putative ABC transport system substrate-binding protein
MRIGLLRRREFISLAGGAAVAWPIGARAQKPELPVVGFLHPGAPTNFEHFVTAFLKGLRDTGYVEASTSP